MSKNSYLYWTNWTKRHSRRTNVNEKMASWPFCIEGQVSGKRPGSVSIAFEFFLRNKEELYLLLVLIINVASITFYRIVVYGVYCTWENLNVESRVIQDQWLWEWEISLKLMLWYCDCNYESILMWISFTYRPKKKLWPNLNQYIHICKTIFFYRCEYTDSNLTRFFLPESKGYSHPYGFNSRLAFSISCKLIVVVLNAVYI